MFDRALEWIGRDDVRDPDVSGWSIHQHLDHVGKTAVTALDCIERLRRREGEPEGGPTAPGRRILRTGKIPRGRAQSPDFVRPDDAPDPSTVRARLEEVACRLDTLEALPDQTRRIAHPLLGLFDAHDWLRFIEVHTAHHMAIVEDIGKDAP